MSFDGKAFGAEVVSVIKSYLERNLSPVLTRVSELEARITALESHGVKYAGVYQKAASYRRGTVVTSDGALWIALRDAAGGEQPGKAPDAWQLAAKSTRPTSGR